MNRIREFRAARGWTLQKLAEAVGTNKSQIDKLEKGARRLTVEWMMRLAKALGCDPRDLLPTAINHSGAAVTFALPSPRGLDAKRQGQRLGWGRGGDARLDVARIKMSAKNAEPPPPYPSPRGGGNTVGFAGTLLPICNVTGKIIDHVPRPYFLAHAKDAYALYMPDDAMMPMYRPKQLLFVNPYKPASTGNGIVIIGKKGEMRVREFVKSDTKSVTVRGYHPKRRDVISAMRDIAAIHTVVGTMES